ncbi:hypothetical protein DFQ28_002537 [Apophysomyces sp. BC1034]|nr:hypothetical protein DFQ30_004578 [Apophysomyces sp. BC1015]KAG0178253.1 hypothetical protein DFQ29_003718 [Apophysomyces sp. BC1021]KAG0190063.1 hypothetical protein DFQ28_002537 [Apophysomyces sp. BC1034]
MMMMLKKRDSSSSYTATTDSSEENMTPADVETAMDLELDEEEEKHGFRMMEVSGDTDSDKDLVIHSLNESLHIHKEILERIQAEKDAFMGEIGREREEEKQTVQNERTAAQQALEEQCDRYQRLETAYESLRKELESKKEEYTRMETNFYSYVRSVRATDDDLSTIQSEIGHLSGLINNLCMGLRSKVDRERGTAFIFERWPDKQAAIREHLFKSDNEATLEPGFITMLMEKFLMETIMQEVLEQPIHMGVSVNHAYQELTTWMERRNKEWADRLRQQISALIVKQPHEEEERIGEAQEVLISYILEQLCAIYPKINGDLNQKKKLETIIARAAKLNLAMKGQDIKIRCEPIEEGIAQFDGELMKAASKGKAEGTVLLVISPPFIASDPEDEEHGFLIRAKVFCV